MRAVKIFGLLLGFPSVYAANNAQISAGPPGQTANAALTANLPYQSYAVINLNPANDYTARYTTKVTNSGYVLVVTPLAGQSFSAQRWSLGTLTTLSNTNPYPGSSIDINNSGLVVGKILTGPAYWPANSTTPTALSFTNWSYSSTSYTYSILPQSVTYPNGDQSPYMTAALVNDSGTIIGNGDVFASVKPNVYSGHQRGIFDSFIWSSINSEPTRIGNFYYEYTASTTTQSMSVRPVGTSYSSVTDFNNTGVHAGYRRISGGPGGSAFEYYISTQSTALDFSVAAISDGATPRIVGEKYWWQNGTKNDLSNLGLAYARDINNRYDILGAESYQANAKHFIYRLKLQPNLPLDQQSQYEKIGLRLPGNWLELNARSVNDNGVISGTSTYQELSSDGKPSGAAKQSQPVILVPAELLVDANRDGVITSASDPNAVPANIDQTSKATPFSFWCNDDDDVDTENLDNVEKTIVSTPDWNNGVIDGVRDLEDFARMNIYMGGLQDAILAGTIKVGLKWKNVTSGAPAIKVWVNLSPDGGTEYLTDIAAAQLQTELLQPGYVHGSETYILPQIFWTQCGFGPNQPLGYMLFEGCAAGTGQLVITIHKTDGTEIGEGPGVYIDLKNIKAFYQRVKVTPRDPSPIPSPFMQSSQAFPERSTFDASTAGTEPSQDGVPFVAPTKEDKTALVFVHGSNIPYEEARWNAETMFKRLYWQGYKGRFVLFYWDTLIGPWDGSFPAHYNLNEYRAWKYGPALSKYVDTGLPSGYAKNVIGHSLGNGVIFSALKGYTSPTGTTVAPMSARNVILLQAAMPASCLDANAPTITELTNLESPQTTPDLAVQNGYRGVIGAGVGATVFNIYNDGDFALGYWTLNQRLNKPESLSGYDRIYTWSTSAGGALWLQSQRNIDPSVTPLRAVFDDHESMSFVARSRTIAAGRLIMGGSVAQNFDVGELSPLKFGTKRPDHSGEFTRSVQQLGPLYEYINQRAR